MIKRHCFTLAPGQRESTAQTDNREIQIKCVFILSIVFFCLFVFAVIKKLSMLEVICVVAL